MESSARKRSALSQAASLALSRTYRMMLNRRQKRDIEGMTNALCFVLPALLPFEIALGGQLPLSEIMVLFLLPFLAVRRQRLALDIIPKRILILAGLWLLNQVATDLIRQTAFHDYSRGWSAIAFTILDFFCVFFLVEYKLRRLSFLLLGYAVGTGAAALMDPNIVSDRWKFGGGDAVILGSLAVISLWTSRDQTARYTGVLSSAVGAVLSLLFDARNNFGRGVVNVALLFAQRVLGGSRFSDRGIRRSLTMLFVLAIPFTFVVLSVYGIAAQSGIMGERAIDTYRLEANQEYGPFGVLLGGRPEILISTQAIADSPIIGHGSWARSLYYFLKYRGLANLGFDVEQSGVLDPETLLETRGNHSEIPSHSILFQSWVWAGVMGGVFWIYILYLTFQSLVRTLHLRSSIVPLAIHISTLFIWDILFSPFGNERRMEAAIFITVLLTVSKAAEQYRVSAPRKSRSSRFMVRPLALSRYKAQKIAEHSARAD